MSSSQDNCVTEALACELAIVIAELLPGYEVAARYTDYVKDNRWEVNAWLDGAPVFTASMRPDLIRVHRISYKNGHETVVELDYCCESSIDRILELAAGLKVRPLSQLPSAIQDQAQN